MGKLNSAASCCASSPPALTCTIIYDVLCSYPDLKTTASDMQQTCTNKLPSQCCVPNWPQPSQYPVPHLCAMPTAILAVSTNTGFHTINAFFCQNKKTNWILAVDSGEDWYSSRGMNTRRHRGFGHAHALLDQLNIENNSSTLNSRNNEVNCSQLP